MIKKPICKVCKKRKVGEFGYADDMSIDGVLAKTICFSCGATILFCEQMADTLQLLVDSKDMNVNVRIALKHQVRSNDQRLMDALVTKKPRKVLLIEK